MFCTQENQFVSPAVPGTLEKLNEILDSPRTKWKIETIRAVRKPEAIKLWASNTEFQKFCLKEAAKKKVGEAFQQLTEEEKLVRWATALKESLPPLIFGARDFDETPLKKNPSRTMKRRVLAGIHLSGLFMFDVDHVDNPHEILEQGIERGVLAYAGQSPSAARSTDGTVPRRAPWEVVFAHLTSSGQGLRLVCKARVEIGNIADNQIALAKELGVTPDLSCIDASRISYAPMRDDVYFLNEEELLNYYNDEFDKAYCEAYRKGCTEPTKAKTESLTNTNFTNLANKEEEDFNYHGVEYGKICEVWQEAQGGAPGVGDRHRTMLQLALDLRYICDNQPELVCRALKRCGFVQDVIRERGEEEVRGVADSACERRMYKDIPKRMQGVLARAGIQLGQSATAERPVASADIPYEQYAQRLEPLLSAPYAEACKQVDRPNWLGAVFASGAMYCTLLTRCWYEHFNGARQRLNPQVLIIGEPATGKSFAKDLDDQIMCVMREQDDEVRAQETRYKQEQKKRGTSSKAQKQDALVEPEGMIRYLPTKTSNNIFFRRLKRAKEVVDGEVMPLHLYMFDSELDSSITAQSGGAWIGKHDLELKAFHNELSGVDYANNDSINDILPIYWNSVTTGTQISLYKKFTLRNINDGLCSRVCIFPMKTARYLMIKKKNVDWEANEAMKQWGYRFEKLHGELPLQRLTDHVYDLCELSAQEAEAADDHVLDYLRKRAVFYATWLTIPRILARQYEEFRKTGKLEITDDDLKFATLIYDAVIYFQDHFFGQMLQDSWDNAAREYVPRRRNTKNAEAYKSLPETFGVKDVMSMLDIEDNPARQQCNRWMTHGFIERIKQGKYRKIMKEIMA